MKDINLLENWNDQSSHLALLLEITPIVRSRSTLDNPKSQEYNSLYAVRVKTGNILQ